MILAIVQIIALLYTAWKLSAFNRQGCRYRFGVSFIASCWAGAAAALAVGMMLSWPEAVSYTNGVTAGAAGASMGCAWWCKGNVADLARKVRRAIRHIVRPCGF